ncbi:MAG: bifunctional oligoribonuclease/PAP phosphatase NrnA [Patescibacteria group bacterium]|nr:bifunctional oligoribonuclease/PAP phosphatase NrnA [Patescibacteria group bacterium]
MTKIVQEAAPKILAAIQKANNILLHCHPSPDPDSVGSALAMKFALEQMGKRATVIGGDSPIPDGFAGFPGVNAIIPKKFSEIDLSEFDLFIIQDAANVEQITRYAALTIPLSIPTVIIDHHRTNPGYGSVNLVCPDYPATAQLLFDLFKLWNFKLTHEIAANLFVGIYADTGGFKYTGTNPNTFLAAAELSKAASDFTKIISEMENSATPDDIAFQGVALDHVRQVCDGKIGLSVVSCEEFKSRGIEPRFVRAGNISSILKSVKKWPVVGAVLEAEPEKIRVSFRSKDGDLSDVSVLTSKLGGGGHKAAAGALLTMPLPEAVEKIVSTAKEIYNL